MVTYQFCDTGPPPGIFGSAQPSSTLTLLDMLRSTSKVAASTQPEATVVTPQPIAEYMVSCFHMLLPFLCGQGLHMQAFGTILQSLLTLQHQSTANQVDVCDMPSHSNLWYDSCLAPGVWDMNVYGDTHSHTADSLQSVWHHGDIGTLHGEKVLAELSDQQSDTTDIASAEFGFIEHSIATAQAISACEKGVDLYEKTTAIHAYKSDNSKGLEYEYACNVNNSFHILGGCDSCDDEYGTSAHAGVSEDDSPAITACEKSMQSAQGNDLWQVFAQHEAMTQRSGVAGLGGGVAMAPTPTLPSIPGGVGGVELPSPGPGLSDRKMQNCSISDVDYISKASYSADISACEKGVQPNDEDSYIAEISACEKGVQPIEIQGLFMKSSAHSCDPYLKCEGGTNGDDGRALALQNSFASPTLQNGCSSLTLQDSFDPQHAPLNVISACEKRVQWQHDQSLPRFIGREYSSQPFGHDQDEAILNHYHHPVPGPGPDDDDDDDDDEDDDDIEYDDEDAFFCASLRMHVPNSTSDAIESVAISTCKKGKQRHDASVHMLPAGGGSVSDEGLAHDELSYDFEKGEQWQHAPVTTIMQASAPLRKDDTHISACKEYVGPGPEDDDDDDDDGNPRPISEIACIDEIHDSVLDTTYEEHSESEFSEDVSESGSDCTAIFTEALQSEADLYDDSSTAFDVRMTPDEHKARRLDIFNMMEAFCAAQKPQSRAAGSPPI